MYIFLKVKVQLQKQRVPSQTDRRSQWITGSAGHGYTIQRGFSAIAMASGVIGSSRCQTPVAR